MLKKVILSVLLVTGIVGCSDVKENTTNNFKGDSVYLSDQGGEQTKVQNNRNIYTCDNDEFFFTEKLNNNSLNFIYGSYSNKLLRKPSELKNPAVYSDGMYNLTFDNGNVNVLYDKEEILNNCKLKI